MGMCRNIDYRTYFFDSFQEFDSLKKWGREPFCDFSELFLAVRVPQGLEMQSVAALRTGYCLQGVPRSGHGEGFGGKQLMEIYVVRPGDSVDSIARTLGADVQQIIYDNQLEYPYELAVGQALLVSGYAREAERAAVVSGYAYPFISPWVLEQTLPYLTELRVFSYGFTMEGALLPPSYGEAASLGEDQWMIDQAVAFGTQPILTLTPFGPDGNFNNQLIHSVVNSEAYTANLIQNLLDTMGEKGYRGIDIDFEYILAQDRDVFTAFVRQVAEAMRAAGYHTSVALAPKTSADQAGLLYEGKDYRALGEAADSVLL